MGVKRDGTITGIHINVIADLGAYYLLLTPFIPCFTAFVAGGCYKIPRVRTDITGSSPTSSRPTRRAAPADPRRPTCWR